MISSKWKIIKCNSADSLYKYKNEAGGARLRATFPGGGSRDLAQDGLVFSRPV